MEYSEIETINPKRRIKKSLVSLICIIIILFSGLTVSVVFNIMQYNNNQKTKSDLLASNKLTKTYKEKYNYYFSKNIDLQTKISELKFINKDKKNAKILKELKDLFKKDGEKYKKTWGAKEKKMSQERMNDK